jgi:lipopolysaccharide/colanic/teichoic acid biosynthesis glycosyltransferase
VLLACCRKAAGTSLISDGDSTYGRVDDRDLLVEMAVREQVIPHLARSLPWFRGDLTLGQWPRLRQHWYYHILQTSRLSRAWSRLREALEESDVTAMPLKGTVLAEQLYGDVCARASQDVDLLVRPWEVPAALRVLQALGYRLLGGARERHVSALLENQMALCYKEVVVDLHWQPLTNRYGRQRASAVEQALWRDARRNAAGDLQPDAASLLVYLAAHAFCHTKRLLLRDLADLAALVTRFSSDDFWASVYRTAVRAEAAVPAMRMLTAARQEMAAAVPSELLEGLRPPAHMRAFLSLTLKQEHERRGEEVRDLPRAMACDGIVRGVADLMAWRWRGLAATLIRLPWEARQGRRSIKGAHEVAVAELRRRMQETVKRVGDVVVSGALLLGMAPFLGAVALLIKADSPGPVFFRQIRIGKHGRPFAIWKLRTLRHDTPRYQGKSYIPSNAITRVGRLLRRTAVDEMPQLLNVLRGEMSLIGPRPEMPFVVAGYSALEWERLGVRPGISGVWQLYGDHRVPIHHHLGLDLAYLRQRSLTLDVWLLVRTALFLFESIVGRTPNR